MRDFLEKLINYGVRIGLKDSKSFFTLPANIPNLFWNIEYDCLEVMKYLLNTEITSVVSGRRMLIEQQLFNCYISIEKKMPLVLCDMEKNGILVSIPKLENLKEKIQNSISKLSSEIFALAGEEFNLNSPKQVSYILFEKMGLKGKKKTAGGELSSEGEVLEELAQEHIIASKLIDVRHLYKLLNTYILVFLEKAKTSQDGRIRTSFSSTTTLTGRLNSKNPNLQNLPVKTEIGSEIKNCFIAQEGWELLSFDYSQIDLRMLAHIANVENLKEAFIKGEDIHAKTASDIFEVPLEKITKEQRKSAKAINFGIIYGVSAFALAKSLEITTKQASEYIENYFIKYEGIKRYMEETGKEAGEKGFVRTLLGKKCYLPDINSSNFSLRSHSVRASINARIQGSSADFIKKAMILLHQNKVIDENCKMILQIHDELVFEIKKEYIDEKSLQIKNIMQNAIQVSIPVEVNCTPF